MPRVSRARARDASRFRVVESVDGAGVRLSVHGDLDLLSMPALEAILHRVERAGPARIVLDLAGVDFIDATGLRSLLEAEARGHASGRAVDLVRPSAAVRRMFTVCRMEPPPAA